jgi:signal transduction histidine kinase
MFLMSATPSFAPRHRARFDALKRQMFAEMSCALGRFKTAWVVPFNALVVVVLGVTGMSRARLAIQIVAFFGSMTIFKLRLLKLQRADTSLAGTHLFIGGLFYFVSLANTGGLGSPLLVSAIPLLVSASIHPIDVRARSAFFVSFSAGVVALALLSQTPAGAIPVPLVSTTAYPTATYALVSMGALLMVVLAVYVMGTGVTHVYERVGFELAERREEICTESEDRTRALEGIAARLAHEVKNPLAAIKGLSTHMARSATDPKAAERLAIVAAEADRLQGIVDGFLSFSRGLDDLQLGPVVPHAVARELALLLETRAADVGVKLEVKGSEELVLNADGRKLRQALLNLVLNAMQASPPGETVTIEVAKCCGGAACMKVIDRGQGMTAEVLERIRRPYYTTREGGSGLGVAVARGLIEQHGGQLHYSSSPGKGTTVTIDMPACARAAAVKAKLPNPVREAETVPS